MSRASNRTLPWAMAAVGALIGLPMFFEIGLVMLIPVILLVTRRSGLPLMQIGIPTLAGLSAMHGLVPPHPGPLIAVDAVGADLGLTLGLGILVAIPTVALAGPVFSRFAARWVPIGAPHLFERGEEEDGSRPERRELPSFGATLATVLLPVVLMLGKALADIFIADEHATGRVVLDFVGTPLVALLVAVLVAMGTLGLAIGLSMRELGSLDREGAPSDRLDHVHRRRRRRVQAGAVRLGDLRRDQERRGRQHPVSAASWRGSSPC